MLGNEIVSMSAQYLQVGDYLYTATTADGTKSYSSDITAINPTTDVWMPDALDVSLADGQTMTVMPHDWVRAIGMPREITSRMRHVNAARAASD